MSEVPVLQKGLNRQTPRLFVAATRQDDGKTTTCMGLFHALQARFNNIGYIKPVGQRYVEVQGKKIDEDSVLISQTYHVRLPLEAMSPIAVDQHFTRLYLLEKDPKHLEEVVVDAFNRAAWEQDFVIIEGTGHAGVGSVFNLSNANVARLLNSRVVIVSQGGVGRPVDEIAMNQALFEKFGVEVVGVVLNKVIPSKIEELRPYAEKGLARLGLRLLGIVPLHQDLRRPTLSQICRELNGVFLAGENFRRRRVARLAIGAMTPRNAKTYYEAGSLIITPGDREDIILSALDSTVENPVQKMAGVILTDGLRPQDGLLKLMASKNLPFLAVADDTYTVAAKIEGMTIKTEPDDSEKIKLIQQLIEKNVDIGCLLEAARPR